MAGAAFEPMDRFLLPLIRELRLNSALHRKSNTESTLDGSHVLAHKRDGSEREGREGERDGGICEGKCLALCYKVIIDFPQQDSPDLFPAATQGK